MPTVWKVIRGQFRSGSGSERQDRRALSRLGLRCSVRVLISESGLGVSGETVNISASGALIGTRAPLRVGATYRLYVAIPDEILETRGRVLRELSGYRYAIAFERPLAPPEAMMIGA